MIAILFAHRESIYKTFPDCDVWDKDRDALKWAGGCPVIAHPPCAQWGILRHLAHKDDHLKSLAPWAVTQVRKWGGILEHPYKSTLWRSLNLPQPGKYDEFHGWTLPLLQWWFGHKAPKATWLYIVGIKPDQMPPYDLQLGYPEYVIDRCGHDKRTPFVPRKERELTPLNFAMYLYQTAQKIGGLNAQRQARPAKARPARSEVSPASA